MMNFGINLDGLTEEELRHIEDVLSRDKKLQETSHLAKPNINNNGKQETTISDLVMAEIERVHDMSRNTSKRGSKSSAPAASDTGESSEEGLFSSFAGVLAKGIEAIDFGNSTENKPRLGVRSFLRAGGSHDQANQLKRSLKYSPGQSIRQKPTLLELAAANRHSITPVIDIAEVTDENDNPAHRVRSRSNGLFSASTTIQSGTHTLPKRNKRDVSPANIDQTTYIAEDEQYKANSSLNLLAAPVKGWKGRDISRSVTMGNENDASDAGKKFNPTKSKQKNDKYQSKALGRRRVVGSLPSLIVGDIEHRKESAYKEKRNGKYPKDSSPNKRHSQSLTDGGARIPETIAEVDKAKLTFTESPDSGIFEKNGDFSQTHTGNESPPYRGDSSEVDENSIYNYEPDTESVYETPDDISIISDSSYAPSYASPMKRRSYATQDSWDESDASSGVNVNPATKEKVKARHLQKHNSPRLHDPHWVKSHDKRARRVRRQISTTSSKGFDCSSAGSSPAISRKSLPSSGASSPVVTSQEPSSESIETVGNLEISLVYYSADAFKGKLTRTAIPSRGTKSQKQKHCDVLCRKEYVEVTDSNLELTRTTLSGAPEKSDGELHLTVHCAKFKDEGLGKTKSPNTYVKCYLLPDRFHNSKMKSAVVKREKSPRWDHKFVLAGFSQSELRERSLEIIVGGWHFKKQEVLGGATLSMGRGGHKQPWIKSTEEEAYVWKSALLMSGNKLKTSLPLRANMKPTYL